MIPSGRRAKKRAAKQQQQQRQQPKQQPGCEQPASFARRFELRSAGLDPPSLELRATTTTDATTDLNRRLDFATEPTARRLDGNNQRASKPTS